MAKFKQVQTSYWKDPFIEKLTPEEKFFYLYLLTNQKTSACGVFEITKKYISYDTGYNSETIEKLINRFIEYQKIDYDENTNELIILNYVKHISTSSPTTKTCINSELKSVKNQNFVNHVKTSMDIDYTMPPICPLDTPSIPQGVDIDIDIDIDNRYRDRDRVKKRNIFKAPIITEIELYIQAQKYSIDPEHFLDYYTQIGWTVGKNRTPMKDWKAAVRLWEKRNKGTLKQSEPVVNDNNYKNNYAEIQANIKRDLLQQAQEEEEETFGEEIPF